MSNVVLARYASFILFCLTIHAAEDASVRDLGEQMEKARKPSHQRSSLPMMSYNCDWTLRQIPYLCQLKKRFVANIFGLRHAQNRLPNDLIRSVIEKWTSVPPNMTMDRLIQCRDLRHESFLSLKCAQEIERQISMCNRNEGDRITLGNDNGCQSRKVFQIHYFDRAIKKDKFSEVDIPTKLAGSQNPWTWIDGAMKFTCVHELSDHVNGHNFLARPPSWLHFQFEFIQEADGSVTMKIGWYPDEIEVRQFIAL